MRRRFESRGAEFIGWQLGFGQFTDKTLNFTANAGQPTDIGNGVTSYQISVTFVTSVPGQPQQTEAQSSAGSYSINGSTVTAVEDGTGDRFTFTITRSGNRMTFEDAEERTVWEKR